MLQGPGDIRLDFPPHPPLSLISQMVKLVSRYEFLNAVWQVFSHVGYLLRRLGIAKSRIELVFAHIDDFWHFPTPW